MASFRLFVQDVGTDGYSGLTEVTAADHEGAFRIVRRIRIDADWLLLPDSRRDLWPDGQTGAVTAEALLIGRPGFAG